MKNLTNEQAFKRALKELNSFEIAILRERVLVISKFTEEEIVKGKWDNSEIFKTVEKDQYLRTIKKIIELFKFEE